jgi:hypothetical protein
VAVFPAGGQRCAVRPTALAVLVSATLALPGCQLASVPMAAAVAGAGTSAALTHNLSGTAYRTFTAPLAQVRQATLAALRAMGMHVDSTENTDAGERIAASAANRSIMIELEPISARATQMRVAAKDGGLFYDSATATEIVLQTEKSLPESSGLASRGASRARR